MTGTFIDTIVICTMTGLSIVLTGAWQVEGLEGVQVKMCIRDRCNTGINNIIDKTGGRVCQAAVKNSFQTAFL